MHGKWQNSISHTRNTTSCQSVVVFVGLCVSVYVNPFSRYLTQIFSRAFYTTTDNPLKKNGRECIRAFWQPSQIYGVSIDCAKSLSCLLRIHARYRRTDGTAISESLVLHNTIGAYLEGAEPPPPLNSANISMKVEIWSVDSRDNH